MKITKRVLSVLTYRTVDGMHPDDLVKVLKLSSKYYFTKDHSILTDHMYDYVKDQLERIDPDNALLSQVGYPESHTKVELPFWMGSMNKIKNNDHDALRKWIDAHGDHVHISEKLDGVSALYVGSASKRALYTRGDGRVGKDITWMLPYIQGIACAKEDFMIRGELVLSKQTFRELLSNGAVHHTSNARNTVSGVVNSKRPQIDVLRGVTFVAYEYISESNGLTPYAQSMALRALHMITIHDVCVSSMSMSFLHSHLEQRKSEGAYDIDGLVVSRNTVNVRNTSGNPNYAFAFKSMSDSMQVEVTHVAWNLSKDKYFKPVVHFRPIRLSGVTIHKATGISAKFVVDNHIGEGAIVSVTRSGEVIPKILHILKPSSNVKLPEQPYTWTESKVDIVQLGDTSESEYTQFEAMIKRMSITGVKGGTLKRLYEKGVNTLKALFALRFEDVVGIDGFQTRSASVLIEHIRVAKETLTLEGLLASSNLLGRGIGVKTIRAILERYPTAISTPLVMTDLLSIHGIETKTAQRIIDRMPKVGVFLRDNALEHLVSRYENDQHEMDFESTKFQTMRFVFSGFRDNYLMERIRRHGGVVDDTVTKKTTHLITREHATTTTKMRKAIQNGVILVDSKNVMFD